MTGGRCKVTGGELGVSDETEAFRWATEADVGELTSEAYAVRVLDSLRSSGQAAIRKHDGTQLL
jgi:8-oxo-dGTP diphosphatase